MGKESWKTVVFLKKYKMYAPGEVAGFAPPIAKTLVEKGVVEYFQIKNYKEPVLDRAAVKKSPTKRPKKKWATPDPED